jgi:hypothetical protein
MSTYSYIKESQDEDNCCVSSAKSAYKQKQTPASMYDSVINKLTGQVSLNLLLEIDMPNGSHFVGYRSIIYVL